MSKAEQTRQFIIESTASLFNKNGFAGTSLSDMTKATGLTKGSIYGNFKNSCYRKLLAFTDFYRNNWDSLLEKGGCPLLNSATEMDDALPFMKPTVQHSFTKLSSRIEKTIELGKEHGEFKQDVNSAQLASLFIMLIEGGILVSKTLENRQHLNQALDRVQKIITAELLA